MQTAAILLGLMTRVELAGSSLEMSRRVMPSLMETNSWSAASEILVCTKTYFLFTIWGEGRGREGEGVGGREGEGLGAERKRG